MGIESKDFDKLMKMAEDIDYEQFMSFAMKYMKSNDVNRLDSVHSKNGKPIEEIHLTRKVRSYDEES